MKTILFISPNFPPNYYNFIRSLHKNNAVVIGLSDCPYYNLDEKLKLYLTEYVYVPNLECYQDVYNAIVNLYGKYKKIDVVESHNEHWLNLEAQLRTDFSIDGPKLSDLERIKRKSVMKKIFQNTGANVGHWMLFYSSDSYNKLLEFAQNSKFPLFAKPDIGVGAQDTYKINNYEELTNFYKSRARIDYIIEEFVNGYIITFDGLCDKLGNIVYCISHYSPMGCYEILKNNLDLYYYSLRSLPQNLQDLATKIIKNMKIYNKFFHLEFLTDPEISFLYPLEVNWRPPGGFTLDVMNYTSDIDLYQIWADLVCERLNIPVNFNYTYNYHVAYVSRRYFKKYMLSLDQILCKYKDIIMFHTEIPKVFSSLMGDYSFVIRSQDLNYLLLAINEIQKLD